jgi:hypothetical protein
MAAPSASKEPTAQWNTPNLFASPVGTSIKNVDVFKGGNHFHATGIVALAFVFL